MKDIKIYYTKTSDKQLSITSYPICLNITSLVDHYNKLGPKYSKHLDKFMKYWEQVGYDSLFNPTASVTCFQYGEIIDIFGNKITRNDDINSDILLVIWTIGPMLEKQSSVFMMSAGDAMIGLMLDVVGSIALYEIHNALIKWINLKIIRDNLKYLVGEFYPGFDNVDHMIMREVVKSTNAEKTIGVKAQGPSLLYPRKSQCSFLKFSPQKKDIEISATPCNPCNGQKCLYYQLGGCHMQVLGKHI